MKIRILRNKKDKILDINRLAEGVRIFKGKIVTFEDSDDILKNLLSLLFAEAIHDLEINMLQKHVNLFHEFVNSDYFTATREFGLILISNLEGYPLTRYYELVDTCNSVDNFRTNLKITSFVDEIMLDSMNLRQWEYGRFMLTKFDSKFTNGIPENYRVPFKDSINKSNYWTKILNGLKQSNTPLLNFENLLVAQLLKSNMKVQRLNMLDYFLVGSIFMNYNYRIYKNEIAIAKAYKQIVSLSNNYRRGLGGPKL